MALQPLTQDGITIAAAQLAASALSTSGFTNPDPAVARQHVFDMFVWFVDKLTPVPLSTPAS